jgi:phosphatidylserine decarboxylase
MIHKEGYISIILATIFLVALPWAAHAFAPVVFYPALVLGLFVWVTILQFFRNPSRPIPKHDSALLYAPADGKVVVIEKVFEPEFLKTDCIQVSIFMSPVNVHVNRIPVDGTILYAKYHPGKYLVAWDPKSSTENERTTIAMQTGRHAILFRQIAGALARRICYYVKEGQTVSQGEEFGFIKFGSRVDLFLPLDTTVLVAIGQTVKGNVDPIGRLAE